MKLAMILTAILVIIILSLIYRLFVKNRNYWEQRGVFYIESAPILGVAKDVILGRKSMWDLIDEIYFKKLIGERFGGCFHFNMPTIILRDPDVIHQVLIKDFTHFEDRGLPLKNKNDLFSLAMFNLCGDHWRNVRHKITPTFTSGKLKMMFGSINECSNEAIDYVEETLGKDIDAKDLMLRYVFNVIGSVAFGVKLNTFKVEDEQSKQFLKYATKFSQPSKLQIIKIAILMLIPKVVDLFKVKFLSSDLENFFRKLTGDVIRYRETTNSKRNDFLDLMLDIRRKELESIQNGSSNYSITNSNNDTEAFDAEDKELIDQLKNTPLGSQNSKLTEVFTEDLIASQSFVFISAGSETTASVLSFALFELSMNPDAQIKVQDELRSVFSSQEFNYSGIKKLKYLEKVIYETIRLHLQTPFIPRICTRDYKIPGTDIIIDEGTFLMIPIGALHKDPQYFPEPEKFDPDRFEDMDAIPKGVYFSFGIGPRMCVAMRLAMLEVKIALAALLSNYTVILSEKTKLPLELEKNPFAARAVGGLWVRFKKREVQ